MAVVLRFKRIGRKNRPAYRLAAADSRDPRDGNTLEVLGFYDPAAPRKDMQVKINLERCQHWLAQGAACSNTVASLLRKSGLKLPVSKSVPRPGRKRVTKTRAARLEIKTQRTAAKVERRKVRVAAKRTQKRAKKSAAPGAAKAT